MRKVILSAIVAILGGLLLFMGYTEIRHAEFISSKREQMYAMQPDLTEPTEKPTDSLQTSLHESIKNYDKKTDTGFSSQFTAVSDDYAPNNELQKYVPIQTELTGNTIKLTADYFQDGYISGKAESNYAFRYGTFQFKIKTVQKKGLFPAIWMLPIDGERYPEIDIYEMIGSEPNVIYGVIHYIQDGKKINENFAYYLEDEKIEHSYYLKFEWTPTEMIWSVDGMKIGSITEHVPNQPMYMIFNLAVGGNWPGNPIREEMPETCEVEILEFSPKEVYGRSLEAG